MKVQRAFEVTTTKAYSVSIDGFSFIIIYGTRNGNGFIAIPGWGICTEAGDADDTFYNREQLAGCDNKTVSNYAKEIAAAVKELYKD